MSSSPPSSVLATPTLSARELAPSRSGRLRKAVKPFGSAIDPDQMIIDSEDEEEQKLIAEAAAAGVYVDEEGDDEESFELRGKKEESEDEADEGDTEDDAEEKPKKKKAKVEKSAKMAKKKKSATASFTTSKSKTTSSSSEKKEKSKPVLLPASAKRVAEKKKVVNEDSDEEAVNSEPEKKVPALKAAKTIGTKPKNPAQRVRSPPSSDDETKSDGDMEQYHEDEKVKEQEKDEEEESDDEEIASPPAKPEVKAQKITIAAKTKAQTITVSRAAKPIITKTSSKVTLAPAVPKPKGKGGGLTLAKKPIVEIGKKVNIGKKTDNKVDIKKEPKKEPKKALAGTQVAAPKKVKEEESEVEEAEAEEVKEEIEVDTKDEEAEVKAEDDDKDGDVESEEAEPKIETPKNTKVAKASVTQKSAKSPKLKSETTPNPKRVAPKKITGQKKAPDSRKDSGDENEVKMEKGDEVEVDEDKADSEDEAATIDEKGKSKLKAKSESASRTTSSSSSNSGDAAKVPIEARVLILNALTDSSLLKKIDFKGLASSFDDEITPAHLSRHWRESLGADLRAFFESGKAKKGGAGKITKEHRLAIWHAVCAVYDKLDWNKIDGEAGEIGTTKLKRHFREVMVKEGKNFINH